MAKSLLAGSVFGMIICGQSDVKFGDPPRESLPQPVMKTAELMRTFNKPLYKAFQNQLKQAPQSEDVWNEIHNHALQASEIANLISLRDNQANSQQWLELCGQLHKAGIDLAEAAKLRNWDATRRAAHGLVETCNACHTQVAPDRGPKLKF
jgi:hypothetical protein